MVKKIIFFQAHPDDLEFYCCHLLHYLSQRKEKYEIKIAAMTKGEYGTPLHGYDHFKGERLGKMRTKELFKAMKFYGISPSQIHFFGIIDGYVEFNKNSINLIKEYLEKENPDIIFACEPINTWYRHPDHMRTGKILYYIYDKILTSKKPKLYYYTPLNPNFRWPFDKKGIEFAFQLINTHKSQSWMMKYALPLYRLVTKLYARQLEGWKYAEGYRRVFYREEKSRNQQIKGIKRLILILNVAVWPEKITVHTINIDK